MVTVLGDQVPVTFPPVEEEISLFLDITGQDWKQIQYKNPTLTYIVTTKPLEQCQEHIALGFYNIITSAVPKMITKLFLLNFMNTTYEDNRIKLVVDNLLPLYKQYGNTVGCITELLRSIKTCNLETYHKLVKYNLGPMMDMLDQLGAMFVLADALSGNAKTIQEMQAEVADARVKTAEYNLLQQKLAELTTEKEDLKQSLNILRSEYHQLQDKVAHDNEAKIASSVNVLESSAYLSVKQELDITKQQLEELTSQYNKLQITSGIITNDEGTAEDPKDRLIANLKKEIANLRDMDYIEVLSKKIPAVTPAVSLKAECILYLKEIKPQIYVNSLVFWMNMYLQIKYAKTEKKTYLIVIFDQLSNECVVRKYSKRGWAINTTPNKGANVVVTNEVSLGFLRDRLQIDKYDFLVVIDRFGNLKDVFDTPKTQKFYLITTVNDVSDYRLDKNRCIGFFTQEPEQYVKYNIAPTDGSGGLTTSDTDKRAYKILRDKVFEKILVEIGVVPNA